MKGKSADLISVVKSTRNSSVQTIRGARRKMGEKKKQGSGIHGGGGVVSV